MTYLILFPEKKLPERMVLRGSFAERLFGFQREADCKVAALVRAVYKMECSAVVLCNLFCNGKAQSGTLSFCGCE